MSFRTLLLPLVVSLTAGCTSENTLHGRHSADAVSEMSVGVSPFSPPQHNPDTGGTIDTAGNDTAADTGSVDTSNCGTYSDADYLGTIVVTSSFPEVIFTSPTDSVINLKQGDPLTVETTFAAQDNCGAYLARELAWNLYDFSPGATWIFDSWDSMPASNLIETETPQAFPDYSTEGAGFGLDSDGNIVDGGVQWIWRTPESHWSVGAEIPSQEVVTSNTMVYQFTWNGSGSAPIGEELTLFLSYGWNDVDSGAIMAPNDADREITIIITE